MDAAIQSVRPVLNPTLEGPRVLRSRWEDRTLDARAVLAQTEAQFGPAIMQTVVRGDIAVRHAARAGRPRPFGRPKQGRRRLSRPGHRS